MPRLAQIIYVRYNPQIQTRRSGAISGQRIVKINPNPKLPFRIRRYLQDGGKVRKIVHISSDQSRLVISRTYAPATVKPSNGTRKHSIFNKQSKRMLELFLKSPDADIASIDLERAGSGKENGHLRSFSRRISDLRDAKHNIVCSRKEWVGGQLHTWYRLITNPDLEIYQQDECV